jgi:hypothetical protein
MATRLCVIMYSIVTLAMLLRVSREFHSRLSSTDVTLLVLWNLPVVYLAALTELNLFYFAFLFFSVW